MFKLTSQYEPTGDQPAAIATILKGIERGAEAQTLLGVTGSGKTFTIANVIAQLNRPTLVLSHNKTLAAQLYGEFKTFFPENAVEYFVSYYDYYQPEAYISASDTYIAKDMSINQDIEKLRLRTTASLLSGRRDVIVVSSVSCLYGMADPRSFEQAVIKLYIGQQLYRSHLMHKLSAAFYTNTKNTFEPGCFRVKGETIDIFPAVEGYNGIAYRVIFWDNEIDALQVIDPRTGKKISNLNDLQIYPANLFATSRSTLELAFDEIKHDLKIREQELIEYGKNVEATRLHERVTYDLEMMQELGYCSGIENYSRYFDRRLPGERPFCLLDYFPSDFLLVIDESHVSIPQIRAMYGGDRNRKTNLVDYGFRLPAALDNRPLTFEEFESLIKTRIYVSATPAEYELEDSEGIVVEQIIRPTGLPDPTIEVRSTKNQVDDLMEEIRKAKKKHQRVLVTTLTKKMAEELSEYLQRNGIATAYIHSDVDTLDRVEILDLLRKGTFDVLVGVNLLREGLDLPEVALVAILDADKEGFLRSHRSLTQTAGRAARNLDGKVIFYADKITDSMQKTIDETASRRLRQLKYNEDNGITPKAIIKGGYSLSEEKEKLSSSSASSVYITPVKEKAYVEENIKYEDPFLEMLTKERLKTLLSTTKKEMYAAAKKLDFQTAARLRDEANTIEKLLAEKDES